MTDRKRLDSDKIADIFQKGVDNAEAPISILSMERTIIFCNRAWKQFHQVDEDVDCTGRHIEEFLDDSFSWVVEEGREAWKNTKRFQTQFYAHWTGQWVQLNANLLDELDPPVIITITIDITDTINAHDESVRMLFRAMPIPIFIWKRVDGEIVLDDYNDAAVETTGGRIKGLAGIRINELFRANPGIIADVIDCIDNGTSIDRELEYHSEFDDWKKFYAAKYIFVPPDKAMVHTEDITERVESRRKLEEYRDRLEALVDERTRELEKINETLMAEIEERNRTSQALARSESRYRSVSELTSDYTYSGVVYPDATLKREWVSGAFTKITGYPPEEIDEVLGNLQIVHALDKKLAEGQRKSYFSDTRMTSEFRIITKDGKVKWILSHGSPQERTDDGGVRVVGAVKDITGRKTAEQKLENRNRELRILNIVGGLFESAPDIESALRMTLDLLMQEANIDTAGIWTFDQESGCLECLHARNIPERLLSPLQKIAPGDPYLESLRERDSAFIFEEEVGKDDDPRRKIKENAGLARVVGLPVRKAGRTNVVFIMGFPADIVVDDSKLDFFNVVGNQIGLEMERRYLLEVRENQERQLKKLTGRLLTSAEDERAAIAHELHDVIGQDLVAIKQRMPLIGKGLDPRSGEAVQAFEAVKSELKELTCKARDFSYSLAPPVLNDLGLKPAIEEYINKIVEPAGLEVDLTIAGFDEKLPPVVARHLYRIAQEALTNVIRHSGAKYVVVRVIKGYPDVIMDIRDDGRGFDTDRSAAEGLGITGIRGRVQDLDGVFELSSAPGKGTHLRVKVPQEVDYEK